MSGAGPGYALVTGASRGLGAAFARALAGEGWNLILSARSAPELENLRASLARPGCDVRCLTADLGQGGAAKLLAAMREQDLRVDLLVNNAGLGSGGEFTDLSLARELEEVNVNIGALVELTQGCVAGMRTRGSGSIVNVASTAAFQPVPYMATYGGTKAFVLSFSLALYEELRTRGVHVMALCPGPTETAFFTAANLRPRKAKRQSAEQVVALGLRGLRARRPLVVCGAGNRAMIGLERVLPRRMLLKTVARMMRQR